MGLEKRTSPRISVDIPLVIKRAGSIDARGRIKDISLDGMRVQALDGHTLRKGEIILGAFTLHGQHWEVSALVLHEANAHHGVLFSDAQPDLYALVVAANEAENRLDGANFQQALTRQPATGGLNVTG